MQFDHITTDPSPFPRRRFLGLLGGAAAVALAACSSDSASNASSTAAPTTSGGSTGTTAATTATTAATTATTDGAATTAECTTAIPEETPGPYPGDGSNGPNILTVDGVVRPDIRSSIGDLSGTATGVPMTLEFTLVDVDGCTPIEGAAIYVWHATSDGKYSMYSDTTQNYLRGVQPSDANGVVRFQSVYPGCYDGRWPHVHFEVYPSVDEATKAGAMLATSQIALPADTSDQVFATAGYEASIPNFKQVSLSTDMVFRDDDGVMELGTASGTVDNGLTIALRVPVKVG
jgi:protocatechuate 3,4-dioxygenase beta subunit